MIHTLWLSKTRYCLSLIFLIKSTNRTNRLIHCLSSKYQLYQFRLPHCHVIERFFFTRYTFALCKLCKVWFRFIRMYDGIYLSTMLEAVHARTERSKKDRLPYAPTFCLSSTRRLSTMFYSLFPS